MRQNKTQQSKMTTIQLEQAKRPRIGRTSIAVVALIGCMLLGARAYSSRLDGSRVPVSSTVSTPLTAATQSPAARSYQYSRLAVQPEADKFRRKLGERFQAPGREVTVEEGTLTVGGEQHLIRIVRNRYEEGERVEIGLDGRQSVLSWTGAEGALASGRDAAGGERSLVERVVLDSPDQFVLAQLRGASYFIVAYSAMPSESAGDDNYNGPVWDIVRVGEPETETNKGPQSASRLYHINSSTGLIDRIISQEQADTIVAEISNWVIRDGELAPARITWSRNKQVIMQLELNKISNSPQQ